MNGDGMDQFEQMYEAQYTLQRDTFGHDLVMLTQEERVEFIKNMTLALADELHEALGEVGWKPWATSRHINEDAFKGELVDAFHFFMNLMIAVQMEPDELYEKYMKKRLRNILRQEQGYDGVATKCPVCKRALDDDAVKCEQPHVMIDQNGTEGHPGFCDKEGITY